jgi:hypothetical protein
MDLEDLEIKYPKCFLITISIGLILEIYLLSTF